LPLVTLNQPKQLKSIERCEFFLGFIGKRELPGSTLRNQQLRLYYGTL
jgi:hypothetical protein